MSPIVTDGDKYRIFGEGVTEEALVLNSLARAYGRLQAMMHEQLPAAKAVNFQEEGKFLFETFTSIRGALWTHWLHVNDDTNFIVDYGEVNKDAPKVIRV